MARSQFKSNKKVSGKKYVDFRKKRLCDLGGDPI
jgi:ribosomal protein S8E